MKLKLVFCLVILSKVLLALSTDDSTRLYTSSGELASVSLYDKNGTLQFEKVYWQYLPNGNYVFVSKRGFTTVKNSKTITFDSSTPDNIIEVVYDEKYNEITYIWKNGKREIYEGGKPDGVIETQYEGDKPGVYKWKDGKLIFIRKLSKKDLAEKERINKESEEIFKSLNLQN
jgi:hypothetical protein